MTTQAIATLSEFADNPFIAKLPRILSRREMIDVLTQKPNLDQKRKRLPTSYTEILRIKGQ